MSDDLLKVPLHALHLELGARMVPFAGYAMPVQYPQGLLTEHRHTRHAAGLFDVSHMGQLRFSGPRAAAALESLLPIDLLGLPVGKQRYGLLMNDDAGLRDDLMVFRQGETDWFMVVNGACKVADEAYIRDRIGSQCTIERLDDHALLALQGPQAARVMARLVPGVSGLVFMTGLAASWQGPDGAVPLLITRTGYTGEDGFEVSVPAASADALARALLAQPEVAPIGLGARNSLRLEAGLPLYGNDIDASTTPAEAALGWAIQKVRRTGGARAGGFPGAPRLLAQLDAPATRVRVRVGLLGLARVPVREHTPLRSTDGQALGEVTSGLLSPVLDQPIAMAYVPPSHAGVGTRIDAWVRGKPVPMQVVPLPFVPTRYHRG